MSLKAKLEAVIYAAEEPVTLAQLAAIFAEDALAWRAEQEAGRARNLELELTAESAAENDGDSSESFDSTVELAGLVAVVQGMTEAVPQAPENSTPEPDRQEIAIDPELEARRAERRRDREVREILRGVLDSLIAEYAGEGRGLEIREIAGGFRMGTKPELHDAVRAFIKSLKPPMKLSLPALETLAVIAYKQPVTAPEVGEIRGVDSAGVLGSLLSRKLIATAGRKQVVGRPILYKTTKEFLVRFGLKDVSELPSMEEFEKMAALELDEESGDDAFTEAHDLTEPAEVSGDLFSQAEEADPALDPAPEELAEAHPTVERRQEEEIEVRQ